MELDSELNRNLLDYVLPIIGRRTPRNEYNKKVSMEYLESNVLDVLDGLSEEEFEEDLEKLEEEGFWEIYDEEASAASTSNPDIFDEDLGNYQVFETRLRGIEDTGEKYIELTEDGQRIIEKYGREELAETLSDVGFDRGYRKAGV